MMIEILIIWFLFDLLVTGLFFAHCQDNWPAIAEQDRKKDIKMAYIIGLGGPIAIIALIIVMTMDEGNILRIFKHGWRFPR